MYRGHLFLSHSIVPSVHRLKLIHLAMKTDSLIQKEVMKKLAHEPILNACEIGVSVKNGVVTLSGIVNTYAKKVAAEEATKSVIGVTGIAEDIEVRVNEVGKRPDSEIAQAVLNALHWNSSVPANQIRVIVDKGWATLEGEVAWEYEHKAAISVVQSLAGVVGITDKIYIVPSYKIKNLV